MQDVASNGVRGRRKRRPYSGRDARATAVGHGVQAGRLRHFNTSYFKAI